MISKTRNDLKALLFIGITGVKNHLLEILRNPLRAAGFICQILIYFGIILSPFLLNKRNAGPIVDIRICKPYIGGFLFLLLTLITFQSLMKAAKSYLPANFIKADENLVFPSPIKPRTMYFYSFLRSFGLDIFLLSIYTFLTVIISMANRLPILWKNAGYALAGLFLFMVFIQSIRFFIYSFNKRFHKEKAVQSIIYFCALLLLLLLLKTWLNSGRNLLSFVKAIDQNDFEWVPMIGWTKGLVSGLLTGSAWLTYYLLLNFLFALIGMSVSVVLADNYYEDAGEFLNRMELVRSSASRGDYGMEYEAGKVRLSYHGTGAKAFLWKDLLIYIRKKEGKKFSILWNLLFLAAGSISAYFIRNEKTVSIILFIILAGYIIALISMEISGIPYEIKHVYFYTLPGNVKSKMFWIMIFPLTKLFMRILLFILPFLILKNISSLQVLAAYIAICSFGAVKSCEKIIEQVLIPDGSKNILVSYIIVIAQLLFHVPGFLLALLAYYFTKSISLTLIFFAPGEAISVFLIFMISERLFQKLELKEPANL